MQRGNAVSYRCTEEVQKKNDNGTRGRERRNFMDKQMLSMEELEQVTGGNIFTDAWDWLCEQFSSDDKPKTDDQPSPPSPPHWKVR